MNGAGTVQTTLKGGSFLADSLALYRDHEPEEGYYLAFSGGKDSIVIHDLAVRAGVKFSAHFTLSTIDPPEVLKFIKANYPAVVWHRPATSMFKLIEERGALPTRFMRFCCSDLKEIGGPGRVVVLGIRRAESPGRRNREKWEESIRHPGKWFLNPILDWTDADVWEYIRSRALPYPVLYDQGYNRIGCIMCPLQSRVGMRKDSERYPGIKKRYLLAIRKGMEKGGFKHFEGMSPEEILEWWIRKDQKVIKR